jgi:transcriptional regulator with XRE-family HTH domain
MENIRALFGQNLKELRKKLKWSQERLGEKADLHPTYISDIERGESNVSLEYIEKLASGLGLPVAELLNFPPAEKSQQERIQSELILRIRQLDAQTCGFVLDFVKMLDGLAIQKKKKQRIHK